MIILLAGDPNQPVTLLPSRWSQWFAYGGGIWHDRISRRPTTRRRSPSGASTPISAMTCKPGAVANQQIASSYRVSFWATRGTPSAQTAYTTRSPSVVDMPGAARPSPCCFRRRRRPLRPGYVRCGGAADKTTTMFTGHRQHIPQILVAVRLTMCTRINTTSLIQG